MRWNRRRMRQLEGELIHHSCRGSQYVSIGYTERLAEAGIEPFVGSVGDSYDSVGRDNHWTLQGRGDPPTFMAQTASRRSEAHTSELQSLMRNSYAVFCLNI